MRSRQSHRPGSEGARKTGLSCPKQINNLGLGKARGELSSRHGDCSGELAVWVAPGATRRKGSLHPFRTSKAEGLLGRGNRVLCLGRGNHRGAKGRSERASGEETELC